MSPLAQLESSYDGAIPAAARAAAAEAMRSYGPPPASRPVSRKRPPVTAAEIARVLVDRAAAAGACTDADLAAAGFTVEEIARLGEAARLIARRSGLEG
jgi:hypothetical protein